MLAPCLSSTVVDPFVQVVEQPLFVDMKQHCVPSYDQVPTAVPVQGRDCAEFSFRDIYKTFQLFISSLSVVQIRFTGLRFTDTEDLFHDPLINSLFMEQSVCQSVQFVSRAGQQASDHLAALR
jgi:hypothetical protein